MNKVIFRQYDIRGIVGSELVINEVYQLTQAIIYFFTEKDPQVKTVVVGMDGRHHSLQIKVEVCRALTGSGIDVQFIGMCPSPALYFAMHTRAVEAGLMITASHNPKEYNGIKICLGTKSIWGADVQTIRTYYEQKKEIFSQTKGVEIENPIIPEYIAWLADHFKHLKKYPIKAVIDCGNGAAGAVMPQLVAAMQWPNVQLLYEEVDGDYPNHEADPTVEKNMQDVKKILQTTDVEIGVGFDGDADRMAPMTKEGYLVPGDQLLALFAQPIIEKQPGMGVVFDVKASQGPLDSIAQWGGVAYVSPSGHSIVKKAMKKHNAVLAGELSCHFFFSDRYFGFDDALYALLRLFELLQNSQKTLTELVSVFPKCYSSKEIRIACEPQKIPNMIQDLKNYFAERTQVSMLTIDGVRMTTKYGWGLLRASNTKPEITIRFEGTTQKGLQQITDDFYAVLMAYFDAEMLRKKLSK